jgi:UPF0755 protein
VNKDRDSWSSSRKGERGASTAWGRQKRVGNWRRWVIRGVVVVGFVAFVSVAAYLANRGVDWYQARATTTTEQEALATTKTVTIASGTSAAEVGRLLEDGGVITSSAEFVDLVKSRGTENALLPGKYEFSKGLALIDVVDMLETGKGAAIFKVTIPEGLAASQVAAVLTEDGHIPGDTYLPMAGSPGEFELPKVGGAVPTALTTLEGLLYPSTYWLTDGDGATQLVGAQLAAFAQKTADLPWANAEALGLTPYEIVIVASLIEKEVSVAAERPIVAAVIYNRLKKGMTLGIDATVRYALDKWTGDLTSEDLEIDSPYNTRVKKGLPPTPIANPRVESLQAALEPAEVDYLYYVLKDTQGNHFFTASYDEFLQAKADQP